MLRTGSFCPVCCETDLLAWGRFDGTDIAVTVINHGGSEKGVTLDLRLLGLEDGSLIRRAYTYEGGYNLGSDAVTLAGGMLLLEMPPRSAAVFTLK